jgi:MFS family permease
MIATLRRRDFGLVWGAGLISMLGDWVLFIALPIYVYQLTGSALATSAMFIAETGPALLLGSVAGVFVDRWDRKGTLVASNLLLALGLLPLLLVHSAADVWLVYVTAFGESLAAQFANPAERAFLPTLAGEEHLVAANALNALNGNLARLVGPALGGVIAAQFGLGGVTLVDALTFMLAAALVVGVRASGRVVRPAADPAITGAEQAWRRVWREWGAGLRFMRHERLVAVLLARFALSALGEGVMSVMFVVWVKDVLRGGAQELGWLMSAQAVGGLLGGLALGALSSRLAPHALVRLGPIAFGLIDMALFTYPVLLDSLWPGLVLIAMVGLPAAAAGASLTTLLQTSVPDAYRGRVFGALGTTQSLVGLIGLLVAGGLGGVLSPVLLLDVFQGGAYLLVGLLAILVLPPVPAATPARAQPPVTADAE